MLRYGSNAVMALRSLGAGAIKEMGRAAPDKLRTGARWRTGAMFVVLAGVLLLSACGKKGPPEPPGPSDKITWPRSYPTH